MTKLLPLASCSRGEVRAAQAPLSAAARGTQTLPVERYQSAHSMTLQYFQSGRLMQIYAMIQYRKVMRRGKTLSQFERSAVRCHVLCEALHASLLNLLYKIWPCARSQHQLRSETSCGEVRLPSRGIVRFSSKANSALRSRSTPPYHAQHSDWRCSSSALS